ncbi:MAG: hypothetical protein QM757_29810 [Paludibaculum sp.]
MAQPITFQTSHKAADPHSDAVASAYEVLQLLHDRGILNLLRGLLGAGDDVVAAVTQATATPEAVRAMRNFLLLTKFFASIPPDVLANVVQSTVEGAAKEKSSEAPGFLELYRRLRTEESRHALSVTLDLLQSVGRAL